MSKENLCSPGIAHTSKFIVFNASHSSSTIPSGSVEPVVPCKVDFGRDCPYYLMFVGPHLAGTFMRHHVPGVQTSSGPMSNSPPNVWVFCIPPWVISQVDGQGPFWRSPGENIATCTCWCIVGSFLLRDQPTLQSMSPESKV